MKTLQEILGEAWTRPQRDSEYDEVRYQSEHDPSLSSLNNRQKYRNALRTGKVQTVPAYKWKRDNVQNTEAGDRNISSWKSLDAQKKARVDRALAKNRAEMPIVRKTSDGGKSVLAGNTRATRSSMLGRPVQTLNIGEAWNRVQTDKLRGPHEGDELNLMLNHGKPAALIDDARMKDFMPHIKSGKFMSQRFKFGGMGKDSYSNIVVHAGDHYRLKKLVGEFSKPGRDHDKIGTLLGYSKEAIRHFRNPPER